MTELAVNNGIRGRIGGIHAPDLSAVKVRLREATANVPRPNGESVKGGVGRVAGAVGGAAESARAATASFAGGARDNLTAIAATRGTQAVDNLRQLRDAASRAAAEGGDRAKEALGQSGEFAKSVTLGFAEAQQQQPAEAYVAQLRALAENQGGTSLVSAEAMKVIMGSNIGRAMAAEITARTLGQVAARFPVLQQVFDGLEVAKGVTSLAINARDVVTGGQGEQRHTDCRRATIAVLLGQQPGSLVGERFDPARPIALSDLTQSTPLILKVAVDLGKQAIAMSSKQNAEVATK